MGTDGHPNVIGIGSYVLVPLFALILGAWASRSIERHTSLRYHPPSHRRELGTGGFDVTAMVSDQCFRPARSDSRASRS